MGQKKNDWQSAESAKTLTQMRTHIDNCKEWLTSTTTSFEGNAHAQFSTTDIAEIACHSTLLNIPNNIGMLREDIPPVGNFKCFFCNNEVCINEGRIVTANPFTRAQSMLLCNECAV